jgi:ribosomal protein S18 acetylase RimI-like enzyme
MEPIRLRPMTAAEFNSFRARLIREYAAEHVSAGDWDPEQAEDKAARLTDDRLPEGRSTPGMLLLSAEAPDGELVGMVWVGLDRPLRGAAWIHDIQINPEHRGKGYGRALLQAAEQESAKQGAKAMGLNVFGPNIIARHLYESSGYQVTATQMRKELSESPGPPRSSS